MKELKVKGIFLSENQKTKERSINVTLTNETKITIEVCHESWQQWGGTEEELWLTVPVAEEYNNWLHGENLINGI